MTDRSNTFFISYSRTETEFVRRLAGDLEDKGVEVWWDQMNLSGGDRWDRVIEETLEQCRGVIVVLSNTSVESNSVADEWSYALDHNKPVFTIRVDDCDVPMRLRRVNWIDFTQDHAVGFGKLLESLAVATEDTTPRSGPKPTPPGTQPRNQNVVTVIFAVVLLGLFAWWGWNRETPPDDGLDNDETVNPMGGGAETDTDEPEESTEPEPEPFQPLIPTMVTIPGGSFTMGNENDPSRKARVERVVFIEPFEMSTTEITNQLWQSCVDSGICNAVASNSRANGPRHPVVYVSWHDAQDYVRFLSEYSDGNWRLPSEAEWEYAARAQTSADAVRTDYFWGDELPDCGRMHERGAHFRGCGSGAFNVGSFGNNDFRLYDMHGNVWEWVQDCVHDSYEGAPSDGSAWEDGEDANCDRRVLRGGSWDNQAGLLTSWHRNLNDNADNSYDSVGFRVVRD